jgi:hypothetical protein
MISGDTEYRAWQQRRVAALEQELENLGIETEHLDSLVHDCASEQASEVNNGGVESQVNYLLSHGWTPGDVIGRAKMVREDDFEAKEGDSHVLSSETCSGHQS